MKYVYDDGGRAVAGFRGSAEGDCVCRAISIAAQLPYDVVYDRINDVAQTERPRIRVRGKLRGKRAPRSSARTGVIKPTTRRILEQLGWKWVPTMFIGHGTKVHLTDGELPMGRLIVQCSKHLTTVIDGVIHDIYDPSRDGTRAVYGYWIKK